MKTVSAVEPNDDMRTHGINDSRGTTILWLASNAEHTGLTQSSCDWLTMASSFHWANFDLATAEFNRILRPGGWFTALWNPRLIEENPLLIKIEAHLNTLRPDLKRVSSGRSGITETLAEKLRESPYFEDVVYLEGRHVIEMSTDRYMGAWRSVNDLRVQLGSDGFNNFLDFFSFLFQDSLRNTINITTLLTVRAWKHVQSFTFRPPTYVGRNRDVLLGLTSAFDCAADTVQRQVLCKVPR